MDLGVSGLASGFDWRSLVDKLVQVERAPEQQLVRSQNTIEQKKVAYGSIKTELGILQNRLAALKDPDTFDSRTAQASDSSVASVTAAAGAPQGQFTFNFTQLAAAAKLNGASDIASGIAVSNDVSGVVLSSAGFSKAITAGTFTVNGAQITVDTSQSLQDVFTSIQTATGGDVTGSYDSTADEITFSAASGSLTLGSATDTSNFLQVAKLYNNGTGSVTSAAALGGIKAASTLATGNFATAVDDGGSGAGVFKINGVEISYSTTADSLNNVITRINDSGAGVIATYDSVNDRVVLTNKSTGDVGISVQDVTGNFAAATGLATGTLERGKNLLYTINGGGTLTNQTNTITEDSSGITGLTVDALSQKSVTVTVGSDTSKAKTAIQDFITEYNKIQSLIDTNTASSTDSNGKVTAGTLTGESDAEEIANKLRSITYGKVDGFSDVMNQLADLGIETNGNDNSIAVTDGDSLDAALTNNMEAVKKFFTDSTNGIAVSLNKYLDSTIGDDGTLATKDTGLSKQISDIDTQIADMERFIQSDQERMIASFVNMESVQAQINQQLQFLAQRFGTSGATPTPASTS
jgi:flagellar hook-associated protein 2